MVRPTENGGEVRPGISLQAIATDLHKLTPGWPKRIGPALFVPGEDHRPLWLGESSALFAWIGRQAGQTGGLLEWGRGPDQPAKGEFFHHLCQTSEAFQDVQTYPHYPRRTDTCYLTPELPADGAGSFDDLIDRFRPATDADRCLIEAFFLTTVWGGKLGGRPLFVFETETEDGGYGHGGGKSTVPLVAGELLGGAIAVDMATEQAKDVMARLLSDAGRRSRIVVFDNLKGSRVSSSFVEANITMPTLSGRQLYQGEGTRPNVLTWAITSNQPSLSKDLAKRSYSIRVKPPVYSPHWYGDLLDFVAERRWQIIADMVATLAGPPVCDLTDIKWDRWPEWQVEVLAKVADPRVVMPTVTERRDGMDDDAATAEAIYQRLAEFISFRKQVDAHRVRLTNIPGSELAEALKKLSPYGDNAVSTPRWLKSLNVPCIQNKRTSTRRFWIWTGREFDGTTTESWDDFGF